MTAKRKPAPQKAPPRKTPQRTTAPRATSAAKLAERVEQMQEQIDTLAWLHAELAYALKKAAAQQMAAKMGPQIQEAILQKIMSGVK
jgi:hypothetical protein